MDQSTREQLLYAEAAKYGIGPAQIHQAVDLIAGAMRHDRAVHEQVTGRPMTPDEWMAQHSEAEFRMMCGRAARAAGLGDNGAELILAIVSAIAPPEDGPGSDERPWQHQARPLTHPAEATFPAYAVTYQDPGVAPHPRPITVIRSGGRVRIAVLRALTANRGAASLEEVTGVVAFTHASVPGVFVATPVPDPGHPRCTRCDQWAEEHRIPGSDSCTHFQADTTHTAQTLQPV